ncbi:hypothetical protein [Legionella sp. W05-934-2]|uniref:hypothetical protein n=1 Tax=Legionella sp. W05-934-2 TaxID=1198649 RepID=UPI00346227B8
MHYINYKLLEKLPEYQFDAYRYYPDILPYQHDKNSFKHHWLALSQARYIYSNGVEVKPVSWFHYVFELVKGFFGFTNHCAPEKVTMGLMKLGYYGYLHGYHTPFQNPIHYPLPLDYTKQLTLPRTSNTSAQLQNQLIGYYVDNQYFLKSKEAWIPLTAYHIFGLSLTRCDAYDAIPSIDPTNRQLITSTVKKLEDSGIDYDFLVGSHYAKQAAEYNVQLSEVNKGAFNSLLSWLSIRENKVHKHLKRALQLDPNCKIDNLQPYIDYYCQHNDLDLAFALIQQLEDTQQAIQYLTKKPFTTEYLQNHVIKDSPLGNALAGYYLSLSYKTSNAELANQFTSNISTIHRRHAFRYLVEKSFFDQAYEIIKESPVEMDAYHTSAKQTLADYYSEEGEKYYQQGYDLLKKEAFKEASTYYLKCALNKRKALDVDPSEDHRREYRVHLRLYAQVLIRSNQNQPIESVRVDQVLKAIKFLQDCHANVNEDDQNEKQLIVRALASGLMLSIDCLCNKFQVNDLYDKFPDEQKKHEQEHKHDIQTACQSLRNVIRLLEETKEKPLKKILAKAYFTLGDIISFFNLTEEAHNPIDCHRKASQLVPENPFYILRYSELMTNSDQHEQIQEEALEKLHDAGYTVSEYMHWFDERWHKKKIGYNNLFDVHSAEVPEKGHWYTGLGF